MEGNRQDLPLSLTRTGNIDSEKKGGEVMGKEFWVERWIYHRMILTFITSQFRYEMTTSICCI